MTSNKLTPGHYGGHHADHDEGTNHAKKGSKEIRITTSNIPGIGSIKGKSKHDAGKGCTCPPAQGSSSNMRDSGSSSDYEEIRGLLDGNVF